MCVPGAWGSHSVLDPWEPELKTVWVATRWDANLNPLQEHRCWAVSSRSEIPQSLAFQLFRGWFSVPLLPPVEAFDTLHQSLESLKFTVDSPYHLLRWALLVSTWSGLGQVLVADYEKLKSHFVLANKYIFLLKTFLMRKNCLNVVMVSYVSLGGSAVVLHCAHRILPVVIIMLDNLDEGCETL